MACPTNTHPSTAYNWAADDDQREKAESVIVFMKTAHSQIEGNKNYVHGS